MPAQQELSDHVEEIVDALDTKVDQAEIEEELSKYLEYNVPLDQAKREIVRNHGGTIDTGPRSLADLHPDDSNVDFRARVLTVNPKEVEVDGEPKEIWYGFLADETDRVPYTAWQDFGLEAGTSVDVRNAYVEEGYGDDDIEVNLGDYAEVEPAGQEVDVGDHGLEGGDPDGPRRLDDLEPGEGSADLHVRILTVNPKEVEVDGEPQDIWYGFMADESARVPYTAWQDYDLEQGQSVEIENAYVKEGYQGDGIEVNLGDYAEVAPADEEVEVEGADADEPTELAVRDLKAGQRNVGVEARVLDLEERTVEVDGEDTPIEVGLLADETGKVRFTAWEDLGLEEGAAVGVSNAYVKTYRGVPNLNLGEGTEVEVLPDETLPPADALGEAAVLTVAELEERGGGTGVAVDGVILQVQDGSGLIFRCPECNRVLQSRECREHGDVDGDPDLRIKAVLDDGTGAVTTIFDRDLTEEVMGTSLEEYQEVARDAMTNEVVRDEVEDELTATWMRISGDVSRDDFGLMFYAEAAEATEAGDLEAEAESLLYELEEAFQ